MQNLRTWTRVVLGLGVVAALGCSNEGTSSYGGPKDCYAPCKDDPAKDCKIPCSNVGPGPGLNNAGGSGGSGATAGSGGSGGVVLVDASGTVEQFTSLSFDDRIPYLETITIIDRSASGTEVETTASNGDFTLPAVETGLHWVLAKDLDGTGGAFSTYAPQKIDGSTPLVVLVVPFDVLDAVASQIDVQSLKDGTGHLILEITDKTGEPLGGVELALKDASIGYDNGPGVYTAALGSTGNLGRAVAVNVPVAGPGEVEISLTFNDKPFSAPVRMAKDTVTYARVGLDVTP